MGTTSSTCKDGYKLDFYQYYDKDGKAQFMNYPCAHKVNNIIKDTNGQERNMTSFEVNSGANSPQLYFGWFILILCILKRLI